MSVASPLGELLVYGRAGRLAGLGLQAGPRPVAVGASWRRDHRAFAAVGEQLEQYFAGERGDFEVATAPAGSAFQRRVWAELERIPCGRTISYAELAARIGHPGSARAVGAANARNPIAIVVPCHRVVGRDGALTGYAGGLDRKRLLLELEAGRADAA